MGSYDRSTLFSTRKSVTFSHPASAAAACFCISRMHPLDTTKLDWVMAHGSASDR